MIKQIPFILLITNFLSCNHPQIAHELPEKKRVLGSY